MTGSPELPGFFRLNIDQLSDVLKYPETAMNVRWAEADGEWYVVIGGFVALRLLDAEKACERYLQLDFLQPNVAQTGRENGFDSWLKTLSEKPSLTFWAPGGGGGGHYAHPPLPTGPTPPLVIYGHCIFKTITGASAVFYRYEHWPRSRSINRKTLDIAPNTFAVPQSETKFMTSGFAVVARLALPSLLPAIFRYELQPKDGTLMSCGASVPLYGQSGGGVEVRFDAGATNRCEIADPIYVPPL